MGKKNKTNSNLGRSLIKDRFSGRNRKLIGDKSMLHTTELQDGYDWGRLNLQSVTEESSFQEFLSTAELAGTEFQAEKLNIKFVNPRSNVGLLTDDEKRKAKDTHEKHKALIQIPRRPSWTSDMSADELHLREREHFLEWRRTLAQLQEEEGVLLTPFEKNLEFWRQLWRVIEKSDIVVQIVDARNPLLFRCEDLEKYVKEVSGDKMNLILINKADFLSHKQRELWAKYFKSIGVKVAFFSAIATEKQVNKDNDDDNNNDDDDDDDDDDDGDDVIEENGIKNIEALKNEIEKLENSVEEAAKKLLEIADNVQSILNKNDDVTKKIIEPSSTLENNFSISSENNVVVDNITQNSSEVLTREGLIELFRTVHLGKKVTPGMTTVGMVGYPNVGKSSTINTLMTVKKVSVSATPGKTKHFQTLFVDKDILLCDCPGLVMPSFVYTKAEMIINGILPIDQMRDHVPPINLICNLIPRHIVEDKYGLMLPKPIEGEDAERPPFAEELLNAHGYNRGFMTANGQPDNPRSARYILKDFVNGKLLYVHAPPNINEDNYHTWPEKRKAVANQMVPPRQARINKSNKITSEDVDRSFFHSKSQEVHVKGKTVPILNSTASSEIASSTESQQFLMIEKPWKKINKHGNKKKREKLRRVYAHLDQH